MSDSDPGTGTFHPMRVSASDVACSVNGILVSVYAALYPSCRDSPIYPEEELEEENIIEDDAELTLNQVEQDIVAEDEEEFEEEGEIMGLDDLKKLGKRMQVCIHIGCNY